MPSAKIKTNLHSYSYIKYGNNNSSVRNNNSYTETTVSPGNISDLTRTGIENSNQLIAQQMHYHQERITVQDKWIPVAGYAPEFANTALDIPAEPVHQQYFNFFTTMNTQQQHLEDVMLAHKVINSNTANRWGCRIPVRSGWDVSRLEQLLEQYHDADITEWLKYGFPISWDDARTDPTPAHMNHLRATLFPQHIDDYFEKEIRLGATIGPFNIPPFISRIGILPLSTRPKKETNQRWIILDLSYPFRVSVNDGISKSYYCGEAIELTYPTIDTLARRIVSLKPGRVLLFKRDLARYFHQVPSAPKITASLE